MSMTKSVIVNFFFTDTKSNLEPFRFQVQLETILRRFKN